MRNMTSCTFSLDWAFTVYIQSMKSTRAGGRRENSNGNFRQGLHDVRALEGLEKTRAPPKPKGPVKLAAKRIDMKESQQQRLRLRGEVQECEHPMAME
jgi:hypothetical protein